MAAWTQSLRTIVAMTLAMTLAVIPACGDSASNDSASDDSAGGAPMGGGGASTATTSAGGSPGEGGAGGDGGSVEEGGSTASVGGGGAGGAAPETELRILQLNLCHSGVNESCFTADEVVDKAIDVIDDVTPTLVTLNEVCGDDLPALASATDAADFQFTPALKADGTPVKCVNGDDYGIGLLSWSAPVWAQPVTGVYSQQSSTTERRVWICMGYEGFVGCTTHLSTDGATALAQCQDFANGPVATAAATGPVATGGDWNLRYNGTPNAQACVPPSFFRKGDGSVQHAMVSDHFEFLETIIIDMDGTTDHPGLEVRLTK